MDFGCVFMYIDDILVFSESEEQHHCDLEKGPLTSWGKQS